MLAVVHVCSRSRVNVKRHVRGVETERALLQGEDVFPIPGTKQLKYLEENAAAFFVELTPEDERFLEDTFHQDNVSPALLSGC